MLRVPPLLKRILPYFAILLALACAGVTTFALGGTERRPTAVPPIQTARLRALWQPDPKKPSQTTEDDPTAPEDETPTLNVLTAGGLPEEPGRRDLELSMGKMQPQVELCKRAEPFSGIVQVRVVIDRSGVVKSAQALPPLEQNPIGQCVAKAVRQASFPKFRGTLNPTIELTYPFYFRPADN
jgi:outer membrane biosynthesis protein TonB